MYYINVVFLSLFFLLGFQITAPIYELRSLDVGGGGVAEAADPDFSAPTGTLLYSWSRVAGREDAVNITIPSSQLSKGAVIPHEPSPTIIAKFDPYTNTGEISIMRMRQVGPNIQANLLRLSPSNFQHFMSKNFYNFAWLDANGTAGCDYAGANAISASSAPNVDNTALRTAVNNYDLGRTSTPPSLSTDSATQTVLNKSAYYYHQRFNTDACFTHVSFSQFDAGDGLWHNISQAGFFRLVAFAQKIHKAPVGFTAVANITTASSTKSTSSFFQKKVTTTTNFLVTPKWYVSTPQYTADIHSDYPVSPFLDPSDVYGFVAAQGPTQTFPVDSATIYSVSQTKTGWTGIFIVLAMIVVAIISAIAIVVTLGGGAPVIFGLDNMIAAILIGTGTGGMAGLIATGFSPSTNVTANFTPFAQSTYQLDPSSGDSADMKNAVNAGRSVWDSPTSDSTPGGVGEFVTAIDYRKALACGGASKATAACSTPAVTTINQSDPRFNEVMQESFYNATKQLQKAVQPY